MLVLMLALAAAPQSTDTTVQLRGSTRLELSSMEGDITVTTWNRQAVRIEAEHDDDTRIEVDQGGRSLTIHAHSRYGSSDVTWRLTVPPELALELSAQSGDIRIEGSKGELAINTIEGDQVVTGGTGFVSLQSVEGDISLTDASGRISLQTVDGNIDLRGISGELRANAVDGEITLERVDARQVEVGTVDGDIRFSGTLQDGGRYRFTSHDGDVTVTAPAINAEVSVSTFSGEFDSDFPVTISGGATRKRLSFTLGTGSARLELESFDGTVSLKRGSGRRN